MKPNTLLASVAVVSLAVVFFLTSPVRELGFSITLFVISSLAIGWLLWKFVVRGKAEDMEQMIFIMLLGMLIGGLLGYMSFNMPDANDAFYGVFAAVEGVLVLALLDGPTDKVFSLANVIAEILLAIIVVGVSGIAGTFGAPWWFLVSAFWIFVSSAWRVFRKSE